MNCPILNHPLREGVLVDRPEVVRFIQKVIVDFRPQEEICRRCYKETIRHYENKLKRAKELKLSRLHANSVSTVQPSSISSLSQSSNDSIDLQISKTPLHERRKKYFQSESRTTSVLSLNGTSASTSFNNTATTVRSRTEFLFLDVPVTPHNPNSNNLQNNSNGDAVLNNQREDSQTPSTSAAVATTVRSRRISDFLTPAVPVTREQSKTNGLQNNAYTVSQANNVDDITSNNQRQDSQQPTTSAAAATTVRSGSIRNFLTPAVPVTRDQPNSNGLQNNAIVVQANNKDNTISNNQRRDSQLPTTSAAAAAAAATSTNRSEEDIVIDSDDDSPRMSLNYYNGTRLPDVQPIPPRRKPKLNQPGPTWMDNYIKDITGG